MSNLGKKHWEVVKGAMRFLNGTKELCIFFGRKEACVSRYTNVDYVEDMDKRRSTSGYVFMFIGGVVSWRSQLQIAHQCQSQKQSILQHQRLARKLYGLLD